MKQYTFLLLLVSALTTAQNQVTETFLEKWTNSKNYLLEVAQAMPEDLYTYKPSERQMTFGQQLMHIKQNMEWLSTSYFTDEPYEKTKDEKSYSKEETIALIETSFDQVSEIIKKTDPQALDTKATFFAGPKTRLQILNLLQDHVTHHRGQLLVYLNLNEIEPPKYVGW
jgi:uncharacterized damage-inducible protein DinB